MTPIAPSFIAPGHGAGTAPAPSGGTDRDPELRVAAEAFEAAFLAEMLTHAGLGRTPEAFGGGHGEDAFASLLVREQAQLLTARGGIGLADAIHAALAARADRR